MSALTDALAELEDSVARQAQKRDKTSAVITAIRKQLQQIDKVLAELQDEQPQGEQLTFAPNATLSKRVWEAMQKSQVTAASLAGKLGITRQQASNALHALYSKHGKYMRKKRDGKQFVYSLKGTK